ncbi:hypothetical protein [Methylobacterium radiodurans]|uniref:Porin family protein n=1 Tax=Methylobacterium radiodurans TaxID=2202828 RepID=A0A2U8VP35_9HYPH|nr:hypothetical protein [Methylobacterium radiodurans]AWN35367.1 hypothetical protein DK427_06155 [Methylobacterium radiodurans]
MRRALPCLALLLLAGPAGAEDFTGFYAGVNAGYAFGRDGGRGPAFVPGAPGAAPGTDLPPSAAGAARQMQGAPRPVSDAPRLPR